MCRINPKVDFAFKKLFGSEENKDLLLSLVNAKNHLPKELQQEPTIIKAIEAIDRMFNEEERQIYEVRMQSLADVKSQIASAYDEGMEKGLEKGIYQTKRETVLLAVQQGMSIEAILKITQLSEEQVQAILEKA